VAFVAWPKILALFAILVLATVVTLYVSTSLHLNLARDARRSDDCAAAEQNLAACWPMPGFTDWLKLEDDLLGIQQGDLRDENRWQQRAGHKPAERVLILEALAKGNLATFQFNQARDYANAILNDTPDQAIALWIRGCALEHLQQEEEALDDLRKAEKLSPRTFGLRQSLANLLHKLGYASEAISKYRDLYNQRPNDERVIAALAHCWQEQAELDSAQELLDDFLAQSPQSTIVLVERARLALRQGEAEKSEQLVRRALKSNPDFNEANQLLRLCLQAEQKIDVALDEWIATNEKRQANFRLTLHENGRQAALLAEYGRWIVRSGDAREVLGWFWAALKEDSAYAPAHAGLADYFAREGQPRRSNQHAKLAGVEPVAIPGVMNPAETNEKKTGSARRVNHAADPSYAIVGTDHRPESTSDDVRRLCAACHAYPPPETFPRAAWRKEVKQGYEFLRASILTRDFPPLENVVRYYEQRAPERLPATEQPPTRTRLPVKFAKRGTGWIANLRPFPGVANISLDQLFSSDKQELLLCDTRLDRVLMCKPYASSPAVEVLPQVIAPSHSTVVDLDGDGQRDILVAGLGSFFPTDDKIGKVVWMRAIAGGKYEAVTLLENVGRVADVEAADFNGDGKLDLVVAVFGWRTSGEIVYLENETSDWSRPRFGRHVVDGRHGGIHVPIVDLNQDGRLDFVALISQEHEAVVAYINQGDGTFEPRTIFTAPHPAYGCSGIEVVDVDGDGDRDVLLSNGDVLDRPYLLKPYHSVQWLENKGQFPFEHHSIAKLYGASRAIGADFDGDKDIDVIAVSFLPRLEFPDRESLRLPSVLLCEQTTTGQFNTHVLESGACDHFTCAAGDWDGDGKIDFAVGNFSWKRSQPFGDAAMLWKNLGVSAD
jgi:tetratricopeptide (TPR) repeat protein